MGGGGGGAVAPPAPPPPPPLATLVQSLRIEIKDNVNKRDYIIHYATSDAVN